MNFLGCYKFGKDFGELGIFFETSANTENFVVFKLIIQPCLFQPPQLLDLPIVALDKREICSIPDGVIKEGIYVVDLEAFKSRRLSYYPGMKDVYGIEHYIDASNLPRKIPSEELMTTFPINFFVPRILHDDAIDGNLSSLKSEANTDSLASWYEFRVSVAEEFSKNLRSKKGKYAFSVTIRASEEEVRKLFSVVSSKFLGRTFEKKSNKAIFVSNKIRHDEMQHVVRACLISDVTVLCDLFGSKYFASPAGVNLTSFTSSFSKDSRMTVFSSLRIEYNIITRRLKVIYSLP